MSLCETCLFYNVYLREKGVCHSCMACMNTQGGKREKCDEYMKMIIEDGVLL